jgi:dTDP-L-rhamnose 4-epimerase
MATGRKVLVTGAAGFIGSHTVDLLVPRGYQVIALDNLDPQVHGADAEHPKNLVHHLSGAGRIRFVRGDVRDRVLMGSLLGEVDAVIHLAAAVGVGQSMYQPHHYTEVNIDGTALLMDILANRSHNVGKIVVASSMSIYGEGPYRCTRCGVVHPRERSPRDLAQHRWEHRCPTCDGALAPLGTPESKPFHCTSVYAITKKVQEEMLLLFGKAYQIPVVALRFFNVYGPRQSLSNPYTGVAAIFLSRLMNGSAPVVFEDGLQSRDFIHVRDIARAILASLEDPRGGQHAYNVGTGRSVSVLDVARTLNERLGLELGATVSRQYRAGDVRHCYADASLIAAELGFRAEVSLEQGFGELIEWSRGERPVDKFEASLSELNARRLVS